MAVTVKKDRMAGLLASVVALTKGEVLIGIPAEGAERTPEPGQPNPPTNAELGYIHEYGAPEANIPARPFLIPGVESIRDQAAARLKRAAERALSGDPSQVDAALGAIGQMGQSAVQERITEGPFVPLAEVTLKRRRARGQKRESPLLDTGQLRRSVTYVIRRKAR